MKIRLAEFQDDFIQALFAPPAAVSGSSQLFNQPGFAVYRNTVMKGCIDALQANYPSVCRLVGEQWFLAAAALYVDMHPPHDPRMLHYGSGFPAFLQNFGPAADLPYLPGVARLDRLWAEAHAASDQLPLEADVLSRLSPDELGQTVLHPHPSARWAWFEGLPVYTIWHRNRETTEDASEIDWQGEGALLVRPASFVQSVKIDAAACAFLDVCRDGHSLGMAASAALGACGGVDLSHVLTTLINAGAFGGMTQGVGHSFNKD